MAVKIIMSMSTNILDTLIDEENNVLKYSCLSLDSLKFVNLYLIIR